MAIRKIVLDPDPVLRKQAREVTDFGPRTQILIDDLIDTLHHSGNGIGLASPQVGVLRRIFVIDMQDEAGVRVFVNPLIVSRDGQQTGTEGCLSIPGYWGEVERPAKVKVQAQDRHGQPFELAAEELLAVCICHENDHLDGILFTDKTIGELVKA
ncbi:MAG: peptide deformylase [Oscillospiraceae bacterium]|nr:peptide deformylase [Oscillospiraceae bacterium]MDD4368092.1 peptide deformylase [Oscillospiraceae bacterium]